jgi:fucose permease
MQKTSLLLMTIAYLAFVSLGLPDGLLGVAWPSIYTTFGVPVTSLGVLLIAMTSGFLLSSFNSGQIVARIGVGGLLLGSSLFVTLGLALYALTPSWWGAVGAAALMGMGGGAIDSGLNAYAAAHFRERHVNWLHACYGLGAMLGPLLITAILSGGGSWRWGYGLVGAVLALMALSFAATRRMWGQATPDATPDVAQPAAPARMGEVLRRPLVWRGIAAFFIYTGLEVSAGQWAYTLFTEGRGIDAEAAGVWVGIYWGSLTVGRLVSGVLVERLGARLLLRSSMVLALGGALLLWLHLLPLLSFIGLALIGFALAPIFPLLVAQTPGRLGAGHATHAIGFQIAAANVGASLLPALAGVLALEFGLEIIGPVVLALALLLLLVHEGLLASDRQAQAALLAGKAEI